MDTVNTQNDNQMIIAIKRDDFRLKNSLGLICKSLILLVFASTYAGAEDRPAKLEIPTVEIVGTTPVPGLGTEIDQVPGNVQVVTDEELDKIQATNLPDLLQRAMPSVSVNEMANNPYQPNLMYRGFIASPLLGAPQGMSVFQDGARINEPFGDVVSYDLIPQAAISSMTLMPGSNPVFGLNTLGGGDRSTNKKWRLLPGH